MGRVTVTVYGRDYDLVCSDDEEERLADLARDVDRRAQGLAAGVGARRAAADEARLLVMTCLVLADELSEAQGRRPPAGGGRSDHDGDAVVASLADEVNALAERIEAVAAQLGEI